MKQQTFNSVVYQEGKYYVAQCLDIDVSSFGETEAQALDALKEALALYLEDAPKGRIGHVQNPTVHTLHMQNA